MAISFGDNVRVVKTSLTIAHGLAGLVGQVYGETHPSVTGCEVIGEVVDDYAIAVQLDGQSESLWFSSALLEFVDHNAGAEAVVGSKRWVRSASGEWVEQ